MYGKFKTYIYHRIQPNVGVYVYILKRKKEIFARCSTNSPTSSVAKSSWSQRSNFGLSYKQYLVHTYIGSTPRAPGCHRHHQDSYIFMIGTPYTLYTFVCDCYWLGGRPNTYRAVFLSEIREKVMDMCKPCIRKIICLIYIPSRGLTYPTLGKEKSSSKCHFWGIC